MKPMSRGRYQVRLAESPADLDRAQRLRHLAFWSLRGKAQAHGSDVDAFDAAARHMLVCDRQTGDLVACCRMQLFDGGALDQSYAAQFYDLSLLAQFPGPKLEIGRFCLHPDHHDPDILRLAWAALARVVDEAGVALMFGCSSFAGADPARHARALAALEARIGPAPFRPLPRAPNRVALGPVGNGGGNGVGAGLPPLLRSYLSMGGWVSDHAVVDFDLDTLHVLTAVEIAAIPPARARALREIAADAMG
jgi:L-ornithine Nalpha-acyltransferase